LTKFVTTSDGGNNSTPLPSNLYISFASDNPYLSGPWIPILIIFTLLVFVVLIVIKKTTFGRRIINTGLSKTAAQYAGYNVKMNQISAMLFSGGLAGLMGVLYYCGQLNGVPYTIMARVVPQRGFDGISVGLIAFSNPIAIMPVAFLFSLIDASKSSLISVCGIDPAMSQLMFGVIIYGAALVVVLYKFRPFYLIQKFIRGKEYSHNYQKYELLMTKELNHISDLLYTNKSNYINAKHKHIVDHGDKKDKKEMFDQKRLSVNLTDIKKQYITSRNNIYKNHIYICKFERT
jgi:simple sugar transport system permease protein